MSRTFVDTNILLDITSKNAPFFDWSKEALVQARSQSSLVANVVVYGEFCAGYVQQTEVDRFFDAAKIELLEIPRQAAFLASQAFKVYRNRGGVRNNVLPDFFIGAHAQSLGLPLITRDIRRYRTYFPTLQLIAPPQ